MSYHPTIKIPHCHCPVASHEIKAHTLAAAPQNLKVCLLIICDNKDVYYKSH